MQQPPPPGFAEYPRGGWQPSYQELKDLSDGYFGLSRAFIINVVLALGVRLAGTANPRLEEDLGLISVTVLVIAVIVFFATLGPNRKLGAGLGWKPSGPILASVLVGLNSALCCGIIGYLVLQGMAMKRIKQYGIKTGLFGLRKQDIQARLEELRAAHP